MRFPQAPPAIDHEVTPGASPTLPDGRYLHWNELRHRQPPAGVRVLEWWASMRAARRGQSRSLEAMTACYRAPFGVVLLPAVERKLHVFDRTNVGEKILSALGSDETRVEYRVRQLIEESISSSEIEGARPTTREMARQMLRDRRAPASVSERMIANNLRAMERIRELHASGASLEMPELLELHRILGEGALEVEGAAGVLRGPEHEVTVSDADGTVWHRPPAARGIGPRVEALLEFANGGRDDEDEGRFVHPIVRAIVAHFWLGYEHPFRDGNGRIARALFYWVMLRHGYEVAEFLSISGPIERSPRAYYLAFAHTETDGGDLTYFVLHQLETMEAALADLLSHLTARALRMRALRELGKVFEGLNNRQRALVDHAMRHPDEGHTIEGHATSHGVHYMTARADLADLVAKRLLTSRRVRTAKLYFASPSLLRRRKRK